MLTLSLFEISGLCKKKNFFLRCRQKRTFFCNRLYLKNCIKSCIFANVFFRTIIARIVVLKNQSMNANESFFEFNRWAKIYFLMIMKVYAFVFQYESELIIFVI